MPSSLASPAVTSCLDILQRVPPLDMERNAEGLTALLSDNDRTEFNQKFQHVVPLKVAGDPKAENNRPFLLSVYNRVGATDSSSYRSPWSNTVFQYPSMAEDKTSSSLLPPPFVRALEQHANEVWNVYTEMYYGKQAVGSVYLWNKEQTLMAGCFLIHNQVQEEDNELSEWNSLHAIQVTPGGESASKAKYTVNSTAWVALRGKAENSTAVVSGLVRHKSISKSCSFDAAAATSHMENLGPMIESIESDLRSSIHSVYLGKTLEVVESIRTTDSAVPKPQKKKPAGAIGIPMMGMGGGQEHTAMLNQAILARKLKKTNLE